MENIARADAAAGMGEQYSLGKILGIWALAAIPMGILSWVVFPAVSPDVDSDPLAAGVTRIVLLTVGLIWLFVLSMIIVRQEEGDLRWTTIKCRLRLNTPRDPKTGETRRRLWLWVIPFLIAIIVYEIALKQYVDDLWVSIFPFFAEPSGYSVAAVFESEEVLDRLVGAWWFFGLYVVTRSSIRSWERSFYFGECCFPKWREYLAGGAG
jgi:uncharacterized protein